MRGKDYEMRRRRTERVWQHLPRRAVQRGGEIEKLVVETGNTVPQRIDIDTQPEPAGRRATQIDRSKNGPIEGARAALSGVAAVAGVNEVEHLGDGISGPGRTVGIGRRDLFIKPGHARRAVRGIGGADLAADIGQVAERIGGADAIDADLRAVECDVVRVGHLRQIARVEVGVEIKLGLTRCKGFITGPRHLFDGSGAMYIWLRRQ